MRIFIIYIPVVTVLKSILGTITHSAEYLQRNALQRKVRSCDCMSSVCPSICLFVCNVGGSGSHRL